MNSSSSFALIRVHIERTAIGSLFILTVLISVSLYWNNSHQRQQIINNAINEARSNWDKDQAFRRWASRHGGLYVRPDDRTPPNPYLSHLNNRDVVTIDGMKLTLMNPAYMMRQMAGEFEKMYGIKGSITGLVQLNPLNKPDPWEERSIKQFIQGEEEVIEVVSIGGDDHVRLMRPMVMKPGCVQCHGHLGFKVGDIRGGVSISIPLQPYHQEAAGTKRAIFISHGVVWLLGVLLIVLLAGHNRKQQQQKTIKDEALRRAQKMDALGKLTSGVAHDFNNMLAVILNYTELLGNAKGDQSKLQQYANEIRYAGERGARLTHKLQSFSRADTINAEELHLNRILLDQQLMLEKTLTARIKLVLDLGNDLWLIWLDRGDLEDAIINLTINAMHAMEGNGKLILKTSNNKVNASNAKTLDMEPGDYVLLSVRDTGSGMDKTTMDRAFEPFYSTKGDKGTGLGLSQVYGFVERSNGYIKIYSDVGHGTRLSLYFPRYFGSHSSEQSIDDYPDPVISDNGDETILIVDDEAALLDSLYEILRPQGYNVICAQSSKQALDILAAESVDLVISDIIMPEMNGYQLAKVVKEKYPTVKVQLVSGFSDTDHKMLVDEELQNNLLLKPFKAKDLLKNIRVLLAG